MILSWQQIPSPVISEIMCHNFDGVVLDLEHGCFNNESAFTCLQVIKASQKKCFIRLTEVDKTKIRYFLDAGVDGIIFSTVETEEDCNKIIDYCYFSPKGKRGLGLVRQNFWGEDGLIHDQPIIIPQIETKTAIDNLKSITSKNFDYYLIGPYDLSLSLNCPGQFDNEIFLSYINKVSAEIPKSKLAVHIPKNIDNQIHKYVDYGVKCLGMDTIALLDYNKRILEHVKL